MDVENAEGVGELLLEQIALQADFLRLAEHGADVGTVEDLPRLPVEGLRVDPVEVDVERIPTPQRHREAGHLAHRGEIEGRVVGVEIGTLPRHPRMSEVAAGVGDIGGLRGDLALQAVPARADERMHAPAEVFTGE